MLRLQRGLARKQEVYTATGTSPSTIELHRELHALKQSDLAWMYAVSKCAPQEAQRNLDNAFAHFVRRCRQKQEGTFKGTLGYPRPKTKK
jgi:putative transposase